MQDCTNPIITFILYNKDFKKTIVFLESVQCFKMFTQNRVVRQKKLDFLLMYGIIVEEYFVNENGIFTHVEGKISSA